MTNNYTESLQELENTLNLNSKKLIDYLRPILEDDRQKYLNSTSIKYNGIPLKDYDTTDIFCRFIIKSLTGNYLRNPFNLENPSMIYFIEASFYSYIDYNAYSQTSINVITPKYSNYDRKLYFDLTEPYWRKFDLDDLDKYNFYFDEEDRFTVELKPIGQRIIDSI